MWKIKLKGLQYHARIGVHEFEQVEGNRFEVDILIHCKRTLPSEDKLSDTIDYAEVYTIVSGVMAKPCRLIETAAASILAELLQQWPTDHAFTVRLSKLQPPLGGEADRVVIELYG